MIRTRSHAPAPGGLPLGLALLPPALALALAPAEAAAGKVCPETASVALIAGQNTTAGDVKVCNDADNLYVTYEPTGPWCVADTNLHVATGLDGIPRTKSGSPQPDQFAYGGPPEDEPCTVTVEIRLDEIGVEAEEQELFIAAQADLVDLFTDGEEGAWAAGTPVKRFTERGNWATYFTYTVAQTPNTSCVCDDRTSSGGTAGGQILTSLCPAGELASGASFADNIQAILILSNPQTTVYGVERQPSPAEQSSCQLAADDGFAQQWNISQQEAEDCLTHLRVSCGRP